MKSRYFRQIQIDKKVLTDFIQRHQGLSRFVNPEEPFFVRISKKMYSGLIHTIISQDENSQVVIDRWNQLIKAVKKVKPKRVNSLSWDQLATIVGENKASLIKKITIDVLQGSLDLEQFKVLDEVTITKILTNYHFLTSNSIKTFLIFSCFKQNVLCEDDPDFKIGLKIFLNRPNIDVDDIKNLILEYKNQLTLFSLCMWKIRNESVGK